MKCHDPRQSKPMPTTMDEFTQRWADDLTRSEAVKSGIALPRAARTVARRLAVPVSCIDNIRRGRIKSISAMVADKIKAAVIAQLQSEIAALEHELAIARRIASRPDDAEILAASAALEAVKAMLNKKEAI